MSCRLPLLAVLVGAVVLVPFRPARAAESPAPVKPPAAAKAQATAKARVATAPAANDPAASASAAKDRVAGDPAAPAPSANAPTVVVKAPPPWTTLRPDGHGPGGVMADHLHRRGEAMIGYRLMHMDMAGVREGTQAVTPAALFAKGYKVIPLSMTMDMHMVNAMMGISRRLTLTAMVPVTVLSMRMEAASGKVSTMQSTGLGDVEATALFGLHRWMGMRLHAGLGVLFPTGSTDVRDDTGTPLAYPMQLGSGTFGLEPSLTWVGQRYAWSWGAQVLGVVRLGQNAQGYRLGNRLDVNLWGARKIFPWASVSARLEATDTGPIVGKDGRLPAMAPKMMPTADPTATGGATLDAYVGLNFRVPSGLFARHRLAVEVGLPVYQNLTGPQMTRSWSVAVAWQYTH